MELVKMALDYNRQYCFCFFGVPCRFFGPGDEAFPLHFPDVYAATKAANRCGLDVLANMQVVPIEK